MSTDKKETSPNNRKSMYRYTVFLEKEQFEELQAKNPQFFTIEPCSELGPKAYTLYSSAADANVMAEVGKELVSYSTKLDLLRQLRPDKQRALAKHLLKLDPEDAAEILIARDPLIFHQWLCYLDEITKDERRNGKGTFWAILSAINKLEPTLPALSFWTLSKQTLIEKFTAKKLNTGAKVVKYIIEILQSQENYRESEAALEQTLKLYALSLVNLDPSEAVKNLFRYEFDIRDRLINHLRQIKEKHRGLVLEERIEAIFSQSTRKYAEIYASSKPPAQRPESPIDGQKKKPVNSFNTSDLKHRLEDKKKYSYTVFLEDAQFKELQSTSHLSFEIERCPKFGEKAYTLYSSARDALVVAEVGKNLLSSSKLAMLLLPQLMPDQQQALFIHLFRLDPKHATEILMARDPLICYRWLCNLQKEVDDYTMRSIFYERRKEIPETVMVYVDSQYKVIEGLIAKKLNVRVGAEVQRCLKEMEKNEELCSTESTLVFQQVRELLTATLLKLDPMQAAKTLYECEPRLRFQLVNDLTQLAKTDHTAKEKIDSILEEFYETLINKEKFIRPEEKKRNLHLSNSNSDVENNGVDSKESEINNSIVQIPDGKKKDSPSSEPASQSQLLQRSTSESKNLNKNNSSAQNLGTNIENLNPHGYFSGQRPTIDEESREDNPPIDRNDTVIIRPYLPLQAPTEFLSLEAKIFLGIAIFTVLGGAAGYGSYKLIEHFGKTEAAGQFFSNNYQYLIMAAAITVMLGLTVYCRLRSHNQENDQATVVPLDINPQGI